MPVVVLFIFRFTPGNDSAGGLLGHAPDLAFPVGAAYAVLILTNMVFNSFGADVAGVQFYFVSPVRFREILHRKKSHALAHFDCRIASGLGRSDAFSTVPPRMGDRAGHVYAAYFSRCR